jgi:hypothetical protein
MQKFQYKYDGINVYLMQFPPMKRTIFVGDKSFHLPFPNMIFKYYSGELSLAFSSEPITSLEQIVSFPWLPNVGLGDWSVCLGEYYISNMKLAINRFWNSSFSPCAFSVWFGDTIRIKVVGSYKNWARLSLDTICKRVSKTGNRTKNVSQFLHYDAKLKWK